MLLLGLLWKAWALAAEPFIPSVFNHGFVNATGRLDTDEERVDYNVFTLFPVLCFGPNVDEAYRRLGVPSEWRKPLHDWSLHYRKIALSAILYNLEQQGFPYESMPPGMKEEYDAILQNSAVVVVAGPTLNNHTPIYGIASVSYDWGAGTAGERRLDRRVPRSEPQARFLDFNVRDGRGTIVNREDYSLLMSSRLWFVGGNLNIAEIKTIELTQQTQDWEDQAKRLGISVREVKAQVLAIEQHIISSFMLTGKDLLPEELQRLVPPPALLDQRMRQLEERLVRASSGNQKRQRAMEEAMRAFALNPAPQEFSMIDNIFAYTGGIDPVTGRDLIVPKEFLFRNRFPLTRKIDSLTDPEVPAMTLSILQGERSEFDSGRFLSRHTRLPILDVPTHRHLVAPIAGDLIYGPEGTFGVIPPRLSETFKCEDYLVAYSNTFGGP